MLVIQITRTDGIQRPLKAIREKVGSVFLPRGVEVNFLDVSKKRQSACVQDSASVTPSRAVMSSGGSMKCTNL